MFKIIFIAAMFAVSFSYGQVVINEIDVDQTGTDTMEFIEIFSATPNQSLDGLVLVLINGSDDASYNAIDLTGFSTDASGFFIVGGSDLMDVDLMMGATNNIQNGPDAVAIYTGNSGDFPNDTPATTTNLIDVIVYGTNDSDDTDLLAALGQTVQYDEDAVDGDIQSLQRRDDGTFCTQIPTPRADNTCGGATPTTVATLSELRDGVEGTLYTVTGEAILTFQQAFRNQKYLEDDTAAILVDDPTGTLVTTYNLGDGISNITGTVSALQGTLQFTPTEDAGVASSTGNPIIAQTVTADMLTANPTDYESEYIQLAETTIDNSNSSTWENDETYNLTTTNGSYTFRASFPDVDYIGTTAPETATISGIITRNNTLSFITARTLEDIDDALSVDDTPASSISVIPNPASDFITISSASLGQKTVAIYNSLGQKVLDTSTENPINTSSLSTGIYLVKVTEGNHTITTKLIIK